MNRYGKIFLPIALLAILTLMGVPVLAQDDPEVKEMQVRELEKRSAEIEARMREAERALEIAVQEVAELSMRQLPRTATIERIVRASGGPVLGVTISGEDNDEPVEGVEVSGVSPGGAAADAGLRAGDVITAINGESFTSGNSHVATGKLLDFMSGVESGDELTVDFLRNGKSQSVDVTPQPMHVRSFAFDFDSDVYVAPEIAFAPGSGSFEQFVWIGNSSSFGDMEMVRLTERLGSYFGTAEGLLVVRAPDNDELQLQDGDVIRNIDGRTPTSVAHAMRILGSYESGETVKIEIMRDQRKKTISVEMPENRQSWVSPTSAPVIGTGTGTAIMPRRLAE